jgi:hypothetical protein
MASYKSYKKIDGSQIQELSSNNINAQALATWDIKWIYGEPCACSTGCCCLWTVPTGVSKMHIELWGSGGGGHGSCNCNRCQSYMGAQGGYYNSKMIETTSGCQYTICAAGNGNCCRFECAGCQGCASYVTGFNLSNFCAIGGAGGFGYEGYTTSCFSCFPCCLGPNTFDGDFGMGNHSGSHGWRPMGSNCQCDNKYVIPSSAPFIGTNVMQVLHACWVRCGCWTVPYGHGGQGSMGIFCGESCCGQGGMGGPGLVKISYI